MEKIKRNVYEAIPEFLKFIKMSHVLKGTSMTSVALSAKTRKKNGDRFTKRDIDLLNKAIEKVGEELRTRFIGYTTDRNELIQRVKYVSEYVKMVYVTSELGKKNIWYNIRIKPSEGNRKGSSFSEDDITAMNMVILNIVTKLISTELVLDPEP